MNADAFRHFYEYHFTENRKIWDRYISQLSNEQFTQAVGYSYGSVRDQIVHIMSVDDAWFNDLQGVPPQDHQEPTDLEDRDAIRPYGDQVEQRMRAYLGKLQDERLFEKPIKEGEDKDLTLWQVLLHVANHGTDHRAQLLRMLSDLGVETKYQDYVFFIYENL
jgi:uncharacterized damage-inducible protein DinB